MSDYDNLVQWCKDMRSTQIARRNRAWNFQHAHGIEPCDVAWNADAIRLLGGSPGRITMLSAYHATMTIRTIPPASSTWAHPMLTTFWAELEAS